MLELREIYKYYNPGTVNEMCLFNNFNFKVDDGEFVAVVGSNGSGKTSMLNIICGSIPIDEGAVLINGTNITNMPEYKRMGRIGRVFQNPSMGTCPSMTILENMAMAENKGKAEIAGMIGGERLFPYWFSFPFPVVRNGISQEKDAAGVVLYLFHLLFILLPPPLGLFPWQRSQRGRRSR